MVTPIDRMKEFFRPTANNPGAVAEHTLTKPELAAIQAQLLQQVKEHAGDGQATLQDYYYAARAYAQTHGLNIRMFADLSGQKLDGLYISDPKLQPTHSQPDKNLDFYDRDSDGAISDFYTNLSFEGATLKNCFIEPAASFNAEVAKARAIDNVTFKDMREGDHFTFGPGSYHNVTMVDVTGGDITFNNSQVTGLDMHGAKVASFRLQGHSRVSDLDATDASIVQIHADAGTQIQHAKFTRTTISMASQLDGVVMQDVNFDDASLNNVSLRNAVITKASFRHTDLRHVDFTGARLNGVEFTLEPDQLQQLNLDGVDFARSNDVKVNGLLITSARDLKAIQEVSKILPGLKRAMGNEPAPAAATAPDPSPAATAAAEASPFQTIITGGVDAASIDLNTAMATMKTAEKDPSQIASPANMAALQQERRGNEGGN